MTLFKTVLFSVLLMGTTPLYAETALPEPSQYLVPETDIFKGKPVPVDLTSYPKAATYKTKLQEGTQKGANFAGHYAVVTIGCGTQCQENWVIDVKTGKILDKFSSIIGTNFQLGSSLMIVNPPDLQLKKSYEEHPEQPLLGTMETTYEVWKEDKFDVIHQDKWINVIKTLP